MKIQKQLAYHYKEKPYYKHVLVLPRNVIEKLGWDTVDQLEVDIESGRLVLEPSVVNEKNPQDLMRKEAK